MKAGTANLLDASARVGANRGLDAWHGPRASPLDTGSSLGGCELWSALCHGSSIAPAGWVRSPLRRPDR